MHKLINNVDFSNFTKNLKLQRKYVEENFDWKKITEKFLESLSFNDI